MAHATRSLMAGNQRSHFRGGYPSRRRQRVEMDDRDGTRQMSGQIERCTRKTSYREADPFYDVLTADAFAADDNTGGWMVERSDNLYRSEIVDPLGTVECGGGAAGDDAPPARPQPGRMGVVPQRPDRIFRQVYIAMDSPVVPTQLAPGERAAPNRFASSKYPRHALMMVAVSDMSARLPPWL